jgi:hypothetical protein
MKSEYQFIPASAKINGLLKPECRQGCSSSSRFQIVQYLHSNRRHTGMKTPTDRFKNKLHCIADGFADHLLHAKGSESKTIGLVDRTVETDQTHLEPLGLHAHSTSHSISTGPWDVSFMRCLRRSKSGECSCDKVVMGATGATFGVTYLSLRYE